MSQDETIFTNEEMIPDYLPDAMDITYRKLDPSYKTYSMVNATIGFGIFSLILLFALLFSGELNSLYRLGLLLLGLLLLWFIRLAIKYYGYGKKGYVLRQHDILYKSGIWWKRHVFVPKNRIQHVEIKKTPLEDVFNLSRLLLFTAGGSGSDLTIPGLKPEVAERLKENLMKRVIDDEEE